MKHLRTPILIALLLVVMFYVVSCNSNESKALVSSNTASLGEILIFPDGYHLVSVTAYNTDTTTKVMYICQSDRDPKIYRVCIPKTSSS